MKASTAADVAVTRKSSESYLIALSKRGDQPLTLPWPINWVMLLLGLSYIFLPALSPCLVFSRCFLSYSGSSCFDAFFRSFHIILNGLCCLLSMHFLATGLSVVYLLKSHCS